MTLYANLYAQHPLPATPKGSFEVVRDAGYDHTTSRGSAALSEDMDMAYARCSPTLLHSTPTSTMLLLPSDVAIFELYMV